MYLKFLLIIPSIMIPVYQHNVIECIIQARNVNPPVLIPGMQSSRPRSWSREHSRPIFPGLGLGLEWSVLNIPQDRPCIWPSICFLFFLQIKIDCLFAKCNTVNLTSINVFEVFDKSNFLRELCAFCFILPFAVLVLVLVLALPVLTTSLPHFHFTSHCSLHTCNVGSVGVDHSP